MTEVQKKLELYKTLEPMIVNFALDTKGTYVVYYSGFKLQF